MSRQWHETVRLSQPPREVQLTRVLGAEAARQADLDARLRASYERGRIEGEQALSEQLLRQRQETQALFEGVLQSLRAAVPQVLRDTEQHVVALALEVARRIVSELPVTVEMVESAVREALAQAENTTEFTVVLHPADLELLHRLPSPLLEASPDGRQVRFHASNDVTRGGCRVHTRFGTIDATRETKFDLMKRSLSL